MWLHGLRAYRVQVGPILRFRGDLIQLKAVSASGRPSLSLQDRFGSGIYTDLPVVRGTQVPPGDVAKRAPEWSPLLRGHPPLSLQTFV